MSGSGSQEAWTRAFVMSAHTDEFTLSLCVWVCAWGVVNNNKMEMS